MKIIIKTLGILMVLCTIWVFIGCDKQEDSWEQLCSYLETNGTQLYRTQTNEEIRISLKKNKLFVEYVYNDAATGNMTCEIKKGKQTAKLEGKTVIIVEETETGQKIHTKDSGSTKLNIAEYIIGEQIEWDKYKCKNTYSDGSKAESGKEDIGFLKIASTTWMSKMVKGLEQMISDSNIDMTIKDIGFNSL